jgi:hypothetical protein
MRISTSYQLIAERKEEFMKNHSNINVVCPCQPKPCFPTISMAGMWHYCEKSKAWYLRNNMNTAWIMVFKENANNSKATTLEALSTIGLNLKKLKRIGIKLEGKCSSPYANKVTKRLPKGCNKYLMVYGDYYDFSAYNVYYHQ